MAIAHSVDDLHELLVALVTLNLLPTAKKLQYEFDVLLENLEAHIDAIYRVPEPPAGFEGSVPVISLHPSTLISQQTAPPAVPKPIISSSSKWKLAILRDSE